MVLFVYFGTRNVERDEECEKRNKTRSRFCRIVFMQVNVSEFNMFLSLFFSFVFKTPARRVHPSSWAVAAAQWAALGKVSADVCRVQMHFWEYRLCQGGVAEWSRHPSDSGTERLQVGIPVHAATVSSLC